MLSSFTIASHNVTLGLHISHSGLHHVTWSMPLGIGPVPTVLPGDSVFKDVIHVTLVHKSLIGDYAVEDIKLCEVTETIM